ncbi:hypothetical protein [Neobacillus massiliamazoniensis]|jgi:hypothetical protein|uniref:Putative lipoprotein n=1 Tax=Neobacillus massiliamazoniensis TaxID=1499688 RepID=A0A0U1P3E3_9BACI|nr:hypothetical protein [Neobacillus massiliamazoniensis]CRK84632.1 putative lipoprotein [Neobacillus massiliamazoniensis]
MIKRALMLLLISSILLTACSDSKVINFEGKSDNWQVIYSVNLLDKNSESSKVTIKYIGVKPIPKKIKYSVETATGNTSGETHLKNGVLVTGESSCSGCSVTQENEKITATITWKDESETIILKNH